MTRRPTPRPRLRSRLVGVAAVAALLAGIGALSPTAAEPSPVETVGRFDLHRPADASTFYLANASLILDRQDRRAIQLIVTTGGDTRGRLLDLDTNAVVREVTYSRAEFPSGPAVAYQPGQSASWLHAHDPETDRLFVAFDQTAAFAGVNEIDTTTLEVVAQHRRAPVNVPEQVGCTSQSCLPQAPTVLPSLYGMSFVPSILTGGQPKLLLLMQESGSGRVTNVWAAQWDTTTGRQDWIYRVRACGNQPLYGANTFTAHPVPIFQARLGTGIYLTCQAGGETAQVVRLVVDANNQPNAEQVFPGPLSMLDALADVEADRLLIRLNTGEGESWWVFDGNSDAYSGVIGATIAPSATASGLDPQTGRVYLQVPETQKGRRNDPGGLLISDSRRAPAPQALRFPEYAATGIGELLVDVHPDTGERRVLMLDPELGSYTIVRDNLPITSDNPLSDLDQLTVDVDEGPGTARSYTGSGHAYGVRALLVGGPESAVPGSNQIAFREPRAAAAALGSQCGQSDRTVVVASVDQAGLSSNLTSAKAAAARIDPITRTDAAQPGERCYPRPEPGGTDSWSRFESSLGPYPRPLDGDSGGDGVSDVDELAGTPWPFETAECSGDTDATAGASSRPLDRGGRGEDSGVPEAARLGDDAVLPEQVRTTELHVEGYTAEVDCGLADNVVDAASMARGFQSTEIPGLGRITVGESSSTLRLYRDPDRGLVARVEAVVRDIRIGQDVAIDQASSVAEAWAAGRPGSAATSFERQLCGVSVADQAPDVEVDRPEVDPNTGSVEPNGGRVDKSVVLDGCGDPEQPLLGDQPVLNAINQVLGSRGKATAPEPDGELSQGTPGGYLASVQKDRRQAISDQTINNDSSTQVPALELVVFNDDPIEGRGRQVFQFAGVDASVTYGIYLLGGDGFSGADGSGADLTDLVAVLGATNERLVNTTPPRPAIEPGPAGPAASPVPTGPVHLIFDGIGFLFQSPGDALLAASVWALLLMPVWMAGRRRQLRTAGTEA